MNDSKVKIWLQAARLRTLPLSVSGILVGSAFAAYKNAFDWSIFIGCIITTLGLQILSNFANDYGDGVKGTDNTDRIGPKRVLQSGLVGVQELKKAIYWTVGLTMLSIIVLIYVSFKDIGFNANAILFVLLGIAALVAAIKYTVGKSAYGYSGFGDVFVFVFFGGVSVMGSSFLYLKTLEPLLWLVAIAMGLLSTGVLNLNNMRDIDNDRKMNKNTLVVKIGSQKAKYYHHTILVLAILCLFLFSYKLGLTPSYKGWMYLILLFPLGKHFVFVARNKVLVDFNPELKKLALITFGIALLLSLGMVL